jgi:arabinogalactan oligomer/maltooligosaccharide transport system permease protein
MGLAHLTVLRQRVKGILFALVEIAFIALIPGVIAPKIVQLVTLGSPQPDLPVKLRDNSMFMLIDGITVLAVCLLMAALYYISIKSALLISREIEANGWQKAKGLDLSGTAFPVVALAPTVLLILFFVVVPLVFSACVAFTNYSTPGNIPPANTVDWVGLDNFVDIF